MDKSKQASSVYDKIAEQYDSHILEPAEHLNKFLALLPNKGKVLDVGCGTGVDADYTASKGFDIIGVDLSKEMLNIAQKRFPKIDFRKQDIREIDFPKGTFDGIIANRSLIHIVKKEVPAVLKKFHEMLKDEGSIYIALQEGESEEVYIDDTIKPDEKVFLNVISLEEITKLLDQNGFYIVEKYERDPKSKVELNYKKRFLFVKKKK